MTEHTKYRIVGSEGPLNAECSVCGRGIHTHPEDLCSDHGETVVLCCGECWENDRIPEQGKRPVVATMADIEEIARNTGHTVQCVVNVFKEHFKGGFHIIDDGKFQT